MTAYPYYLCDYARRDGTTRIVVYPDFLSTLGAGHPVGRNKPRKLNGRVNPHKLAERLTVMAQRHLQLTSKTTP